MTSKMTVPKRMSSLDETFSVSTESLSYTLSDHSHPSREGPQSNPRPPSVPVKPLLTKPSAFLVLSILLALLVITSMVLEGFLIRKHVASFYSAPGLCAAIFCTISIILGLLLLRYQSNTFAIVTLIADAVAVCANIFAILSELLIYFFGKQPPGSTVDTFHLAVSMVCIFEVIVFLIHFLLTARATLTHFKKALLNEVQSEAPPIAE